MTSEVRDLRSTAIVGIAFFALIVSGCTGPVADDTSTSATTMAEVTTVVPPDTGSESTTTTTSIPAPGETVDPNLPPAFSGRDIPWDQVGAGWYLVLYDSSRANPETEADVREGPVVLYLVDGVGQRYEVASWLDGWRPDGLIDGTANVALLVGTGSNLDERVFATVDLVTGVTTTVHTVGFPENSYGMYESVTLTRPGGENLVVYGSDGATEWLERRSSGGDVLSRIYEQPYTDELSALGWMYGYEGTSIVVSHRGGMTIVSNTGEVLEEIWSPEETRCQPVRWWDTDTLLAACYGRSANSAPIDDTGNVHNHYGRIWLLETDGSTGAALTEYPEAPPIVVDFGYHDAWPTDTAVFMQWSGDCGAASVAILQADGTGEFIDVSTPPTIQVDGEEMVDIVDERIAVYGWQGCDGWIGTLFVTTLEGEYLHDLVPVINDGRGAIGVVGLGAVYP
jgi:TolB protein